MQYSFNSIALAAFSVLTVVSANPVSLAGRDGGFGTHSSPLNSQPSGNPIPISTPANIGSLNDCLAQCKANSQCVNYTFESNVCKLFGPAGEKRDLETRQGDDGGFGTHDSPMNSQPIGNPTPISTPAATDLAACLAQCKSNGQCVNYTFISGVCKLFGPATKRDVETRQAGSGGFGTHASPMNSQPQGNPTPISTPAATDLAACLAQCKSNSQCVNYTFASGVCKLFGPANIKRDAQAQGGNDGAAAGGAGSNGATATNQGATNGGTTGSQTGATGTHDNPQNAVPAGNPTPIATPANINSLADCLAQCQGNAACVNYTFVSGVCKLFA